MLFFDSVIVVGNDIVEAAVDVNEVTIQTNVDAMTSLSSAGIAGGASAAGQSAAAAQGHVWQFAVLPAAALFDAAPARRDYTARSPSSAPRYRAASSPPRTCGRRAPGRRRLPSQACRRRWASAVSTGNSRRSWR
jgi:hypothetical protein